MHRRNFLLLLSGLLAVFALSVPAGAAPEHLFKIASIAPDGSVWARRFQDFAREVEQKSNGEVVFKSYAGGIMGDDQAMYRKMQIGQLHGGGFTMAGIGHVVPDFRVLGIPFLFRSYEEVDWVMQGLRPHFDRAFAEKGLELIAMTEVGFIYSMSTFPITTLDDLKKSKSWSPEGDPISATFLRTLGITPIPLSIPDVLTSLQTGMIDTVYNSLYGTIVLQWFTKAKYISDTPFGYAYGALLLDRKRFSRLPPEYAALVRESAEKHFSLLIEDTRRSNEEARQVLQDNNVVFTVPASGEIQKLCTGRDETVSLMRDKAFTAGVYDTVMQRLNEFRTGVETAGRK
ncbi:MAG: TRAP transporter substrate-binding protein DctP [Desulfobulbaceae bacterium]|jgi:TRAP-type C4-dicarboxylate transport system substrate-binding protein|nr:TRAP transporter substrate-binding protein DctP [Desulfobulbaceae bacterium]MDY0352026.1 TRAP transporter substrate-binding protein DctP [Desulfobulbaceae bacterium]